MEATIEIKESEYDDPSIKTSRSFRFGVDLASALLGSGAQPKNTPKKMEFHVELTLTLTEEERALVYKYGLNKLKIDEHPKYSKRTLAAFIQDQKNQKGRFSSAQMVGIANAQIQLAPNVIEYVTIENLFQQPYIRIFDSRQDAHEYCDKLEKSILLPLKNNIDYYRGEAARGDKRTISF